jgi:O-antigen ligase
LKDSQIRLLQVFIGLLAVELAFSTDVIGGAQHVLNLVTIFGLLVYVARARSHPEVWYWSAMASGVLAGLGGLVFFLQKDSLPQVNANAWSFFPLTALFTTCICFASPVRGRRSRGLVILTFVNAGWVFLSGSRGSFFICVVCLVFVFIRLQSVKGIGLTLAAAILGAIALAGGFGFLQNRALFRLTELLDQERSLTERTSGRWDLALGGWNIFLDHPLGVGTGGFPRAWASYSNQRGSAAFRGWEKQAHSGWIKVLVENGIPGILLFGGFVLSFSVVGWLRRKNGMFLPGLVVTLVLSVAFLADEFQGKGLWYLCGAVILFSRLAPAPGVAGRSSRRVRSLLGPRSSAYRLQQGSSR